MAFPESLWDWGAVLSSDNEGCVSFDIGRADAIWIMCLLLVTLVDVAASLVPPFLLPLVWIVVPPITFMSLLVVC